MHYVPVFTHCAVTNLQICKDLYGLPERDQFVKSDLATQQIILCSTMLSLPTDSEAHTNITTTCYEYAKSLESHDNDLVCSFSSQQTNATSVAQKPQVRSSARVLERVNGTARPFALHVDIACVHLLRFTFDRQDKSATLKTQVGFALIKATTLRSLAR